MSLLLDALKKAADDKQKASQHDEVDTVTSDAPPAIKEPVADVAGEVTAAASTTDDELGELTLDSIEVEDVADIAAVENNEPAEEDESETEPPPLKLDNALDREKAASYTVSDEALSMLIYKTNHDVKRSKRLLLAGILLVSIAILVTGGVYYYTDMQAEIANLERKHQIAMQMMRSKTNNETTPVESKIIRNLVSDSDLEDKVEFAKKQMAKERVSQREKRRPVASLKNKTGAASTAVTFQKTKKVDPVAKKLESAWLAYEDAQYGRAKILYKETLEIEGDNRDALLGLGAIAIVEKDNTAAKKVYISLLKQDPRDPIAISALANLQSTEASAEADERYLLNMLKKNPDEAHLNFALGNIYAQQAKWKLAQQSYFSAWQKDNKNADYLFNLAVSMDQLGKNKQAVGFYQDCLDQSDSSQVSFSREAVKKRITELSGS
ncbi:MAG: hypothetical protein IMF15_10155 [Proteobacteria bacterium]|nr:hypothetical protein [Pseudomonadota bacterium]